MIVDISKHQGDIDWGQLAPSLDFVIMKATGDKHNGTDPTFAYNVNQCKAHGVPFHVFHFMRSLSVNEARKEAAYFYSVASPHNPISYVVDVEEDSLACGIAVEMTKAFIAELRRLGAGCIGLYTGHNAYTEFGFAGTGFDWLWIARYGDKNDGNLPDKNHRPVPCDLWQYSSHGKAPGIAGDVDVDIIWGDKPLSYFTGGDVMPVTIGSAHIDENGKAHGGKPGNQTGKEVASEKWYKHSKGWLVFRPKSRNQAEKIADDMAFACQNKHIGYDQYERSTLYNVAKPVGFDCSKVDVDCETDCSALIRVCCAYAGILLKNFNTETEPEVLRSSGKFIELTASRYEDSSDYLRRGDILVTKTKGHTVVVLTDGKRAGEDFNDGKRILKKGDTGEDVAEMQRKLMALGYDLGPYGADGDFGSKTLAAVKKFQKDHALEVDGKFGPKTEEMLEKLVSSIPHKVRITGGNCYVRTAPNANAQKLGVAKSGEEFDWGFITSENGWQLIDYQNQNGWVSGKYGKLVE